MQVLSSEGGSRYCSITDEKGNSLLHIAARDGDQQFVRLLIQVLYMYEGTDCVDSVCILCHHIIPSSYRRR